MDKIYSYVIKFPETAFPLAKIKPNETETGARRTSELIIPIYLLDLESSLSSF